MDLIPPAPRYDEEIPGYCLAFSDDFNEKTLDLGRWVPHYLPHWSSRARSSPSYHLYDSSLVLFISEDQGPWCPEFDGELRVSALQTGQFSGDLGSKIGQHRFNKEVCVREIQTTMRLFTPLYGRIVLRARAKMLTNSLVSLFLIGFEEIPENSGEITVMEVFGHDVHSDGVIIGRGIKSINDDRLETEIVKTKLPIRITDWHIYAMDWSRDGVKFYLDNELISSSDQSPRYTMQLMLTFYQLSSQNGAGHNPRAEFEIDYVRGYAKQ
jgi:hypothetical protein